MIVQCPNCQVRLRSHKVCSVGQLLVLCPRCRIKFKVNSKQPIFQALIAHEDTDICQQLSERILQLGGAAVFCRDYADVFSRLQIDADSVLLLDVAFNGTFPFQLIDEIKTSGKQQHKIILLSSVYNRAAYKKRPETLYGADAYLELHHIGDRLVPTLAELFPRLPLQLKVLAPVLSKEGERSLDADDIFGQADSLAKLLVADIILYHQDQLQQGIESGQLEQLFAEPLAEGRRMLTSWLPASADLPNDFILQAFDAVCQSYTCS